jgi:hypothetical protein
MIQKTDPLVIWDDDARVWRLMNDVLGPEASVILPHPFDDVASDRFDLRDMIYEIGTSDLEDHEVGRAIEGVPLRFLDRLARR